jgi:peptidyl-prolyl cis-trans isomerase B (cyclophilin B)
MHDDAPHLDGDYAGFGMVKSGMDVVDSIVSAYYIGMKGTIEKVEVEE